MSVHWTAEIPSIPYKFNDDSSQMFSPSKIKDTYEKVMIDMREANGNHSIHSPLLGIVDESITINAVTAMLEAITEKIDTCPLGLDNFDPIEANNSETLVSLFYNLDFFFHRNGEFSSTLEAPKVENLLEKLSLKISKRVDGQTYQKLLDCSAQIEKAANPHLYKKLSFSEGKKTEYLCQCIWNAIFGKMASRDNLNC